MQHKYGVASFSLSYFQTHTHVHVYCGSNYDGKSTSMAAAVTNGNLYRFRYQHRWWCKNNQRTRAYAHAHGRSKTPKFVEPRQTRERTRRKISMRLYKCFAVDASQSTLKIMCVRVILLHVQHKAVAKNVHTLIQTNTNGGGLKYRWHRWAVSATVENGVISLFY